MPNISQPDWLPDALIDRLRTAKVLTNTPTGEPEDMWRMMTFLDRAMSGLNRKNHPAAGVASTAAVRAES